MDGCLGRVACWVFYVKGAGSDAEESDCPRWLMACNSELTGSGRVGESEKGNARVRLLSE